MGSAAVRRRGQRLETPFGRRAKTSGTRDRIFGTALAAVSASCALRPPAKWDRRRRHAR